MNKLWTVALVLAVGAAAFLLGRQTQSVPASDVAAPIAAPTPAAAAVAAAAANAEKSNSQSLSAQPPQTFRGPDGLPRLIAYDVGVVPDSGNRELVKAAMLADMKNHPRNIERSYELSAEEIAAIVAGSKPFPEILLPKPGATPGK